MLLFTPENTVVGFIGTGVMGKNMAGHLLAAGYPLIVYSRTQEKANDLLEKGASWVESPKEMAEKANVIFTMVGYPSDVEEIYFGEMGLIKSAKAGSLLIDMTTSAPSLAMRIFDRAKERGIHTLDAPVSGGDVGAKEAKLSIMVGGEERDFEYKNVQSNCNCFEYDWCL
jgi:3-hydroxyisobutyrate dehydrogenase